MPKWAVVWWLKHKKVDPAFKHSLRFHKIFQIFGHYHFSFNRGGKRGNWLKLDNMQMRFLAIEFTSNDLFFPYLISKKYYKGAVPTETSPYEQNCNLDSSGNNVKQE